MRTKTRGVVFRRMASYGGVIELVESVPGGFLAVFVAVFVGLFTVILIVLCGKRKSTSERDEGNCSQEPAPEKVIEQQELKIKGLKTKQSHSVKKGSLPSHPLLAGEFKGHTGNVLSLDFDTSGKYLGSCSDDRTIRLWYMKTLLDKEHKYVRRNVELDHATRVKFSPDGTAVLATMAVSGTINVYRIAKVQKGGMAKLVDAPVEFPKLPSQSILSLGIASTGKFIMTYGLDSFSVWSLKGEELTTVATLQSPNTAAAVSPCGKFVACAGFTSDVKLWEVEFSKSGEFQKVSKAMDLKGHHASVLDISFSGDSHSMATVSRDGSWKFWKIDVQYKLSEDPKLLVTGSVSASSRETLVSLAPDARVVGVSVDLSIYIYATSSGELLASLDSVHKGAISALIWEPSSRYLVSAGGEDKHIRVWHNAPGMKQLLLELEDKLPKASSEPLKRRITDQIRETRDFLDSIGYEN